MKKLNDFLNTTWWMLLVRGIVLLFFGGAALLWPTIPLASLAILFALFLLADGVMEILTGMSAMESHRYWFLIIGKGVLEVGAGIFALTNADFDISGFALLAGLILFATGVLSIIITLEEYTNKIKFVHIVAGVIGVLAGIIILLYPSDQGLEFVWALGAYGLLAGTMIIASAIDIKGYLDSR